jgi:mannose-6-phosphate isomerase-like protein (cupin superfamily)
VAAFSAFLNGIAAVGQRAAQPVAARMGAEDQEQMDRELRTPDEAASIGGPTGVVRVPAGADRYGGRRGFGTVSTIDFKLVPADAGPLPRDTSGGSDGPLVLEITHHAPGGPARHLHHGEDEWFYVLEGAFAFEVGHPACAGSGGLSGRDPSPAPDPKPEPETALLGPGDSLLAPRGIPHVWASVGPARGRLLIALLPAGRLEAFFVAATAAHAVPPRDAPDLFRAHGMELVGPPLSLPVVLP